MKSQSETQFRASEQQKYLWMHHDLKKDKGDFEQRKPKYQSAPADYSDYSKMKGGQAFDWGKHSF